MILDTLTDQDCLFIESGLLPVHTKARIISLDVRGKGKRDDLSVLAIAEAVRMLEPFPVQALEEALGQDG